MLPVWSRPEQLQCVFSCQHWYCSISLKTHFPPPPAHSFFIGYIWYGISPSVSQAGICSCLKIMLKPSTLFFPAMSCELYLCPFSSFSSLSSRLTFFLSALLYRFKNSWKKIGVPRCRLKKNLLSPHQCFRTMDNSRECSSHQAFPLFSAYRNRIAAKEGTGCASRRTS